MVRGVERVLFGDTVVEGDDGEGEGEVEDKKIVSMFERPVNGC